MFEFPWSLYNPPLQKNPLMLFFFLLYSTLPKILLEGGLSELSSSHHNPLVQEV